MENQSLYQKLFKAKQSIGKISKDATNPFFKSKYFDVNSLLEHVEPILRDNNLLILQPVIDGAVTTQIIDVETGQLISSSVKLSGNTDPQKLGSEITYYRRYTLQSILSLQAEDDDANSVSQSKSAPAPAGSSATDDKPWLNEGDAFNKAVAYLKEHGEAGLTEIRKKYKISKTIQEKLLVSCQ